MSLRSFFIALHMILTIGAAAADQDGRKRIALVIGNGFYRGLSTPMASVGDALAVGRTFEKMAFTKVTIRIDLTRDAFEHELRDFERDAADADWAVVYYAGGGLRVENANYLIPIDARPAVDLDVASVAISLDSILRAVSNARTLRLIILDTARGTSAVSQLLKASSTRLISEGLAPLPRNDDLVLYSRLRDASGGDDAGRSPLSKALSNNLLTPGIRLGDLLHRVQAEVSESTHLARDAPLLGPMPISDVVLSDEGHGGGTGAVPHQSGGSPDKPTGTKRSTDCFVFLGEKAC